MTAGGQKSCCVCRAVVFVVVGARDFFSIFISMVALLSRLSLHRCGCSTGLCVDASYCGLRRPAVCRDGDVVVSSGAWLRLKVWVVLTGARVAGVICVAYFRVGVACDGFLRAGLAAWTYQMTGAITASPVIDSRGVVYVGTMSGYIMALNVADGSPFWAKPKRVTTSAIQTSLALSKDQQVPPSVETHSAITFFCGCVGGRSWASRRDVCAWKRAGLAVQPFVCLGSAWLCTLGSCYVNAVVPRAPRDRCCIVGLCRSFCTSARTRVCWR